LQRGQGGLSCGSRQPRRQATRFAQAAPKAV
jgi:hypothetical protein